MATCWFDLLIQYTIRYIYISTYLTIVVLNSQPFVTYELVFFTRLDILDGDSTQEPRSKVIVAQIVMPYSNVMQVTQWPGDKKHTNTLLA